MTGYLSAEALADARAERRIDAVEDAREHGDPADDVEIDRALHDEERMRGW